MEQWRDVKDYEGIYQVSDHGNVKSLSRTADNGWRVRLVNERLLKQSPVKDGYLAVTLYKDKGKRTCKVHQMVAEAFLSHVSDGFGTVVDHKDNDVTNNLLSNLQLITNRLNASKDRVGTSIYTGVSWRSSSSKWVSQIQIEGKSIWLGSYECEVKASEAYQDRLKTLDNGKSKD